VLIAPRVVLGLSGALVSAWVVQVDAQEPALAEVRLLAIDGVINPLTARYLERELDDAAAAGATAVVLRLDTPGGLESSMRSCAAAAPGRAYRTDCRRGGGRA
jgi:membrane-bound serine protease (ClpP class)